MAKPRVVFVSPFPVGYWAAEFDTAHNLPPVAEVLAARECYGVSRYRTGSGEWPAVTLTVSWGLAGVWVERVSAYISLGEVPRQTKPAKVWSAWVPRCMLPRPLKGWPTALASFAAAPSVNRLAGMDGFGCEHSWASPEGRGEAEYVWPDEYDHNQWRVISAYGRLELIAWLYSWQRLSAEVGIRRTRRRR